MILPYFSRHYHPIYLGLISVYVFEWRARNVVGAMMLSKFIFSIVVIFILLAWSGCTYTIDPRSLDEIGVPTAVVPPVVVPPVVAPPAVVPPIVVPIDSNAVALPPTTPPVKPPVATTLTLSTSEVAKHATRSNCWMIIDGSVYDLSTFFNHPGGTRFVPYCGKDGTNAYYAQGHSNYADALLTNYFVGKLNGTIPLSSVSG